MALRADFLQALRDADGRIAALSPGPHVEARIRARLRGAPISDSDGRSLVDRARRPALVVLLAAVAALVVLESSGDPSAARSAPLADSADPPDEGEPPATKEGASSPSESGGDCIDPRSGGECVRRASPRGADPAPASDEPSQRRPAPRAPPRSMDPPLLYPRDREPDPSPDSGAMRLSPSPWESPGAPSRAPGQSPPRAMSVTSYGVLGRPSDEPSTPSSRDLMSPSSGRSEAPSAPTSKPDAPHPPPPEAPGAPEEVASCKPPDEWKNLAYAECKEQGLLPLELAFIDDCGDGTYLHIELKCGAPAAADPANGGEYCVADALGDGTTCEPPDHWKAMAFEACAKQSIKLVDLYLSEDADCEGGGSRYAKYLCCGGNAPEPPPPPDLGSCLAGEVGGECMSKDGLVEYVNLKCSNQGLVLSEIAALKFCNGGEIAYATFVCCPAE